MENAVNRQMTERPMKTEQDVEVDVERLLLRLSAVRLVSLDDAESVRAMRPNNLLDLDAEDDGPGRAVVVRYDDFHDTLAALRTLREQVERLRGVGREFNRERFEAVERAERAEARVAELEAVLREVEEAASDVMGTLNYYIGPAARTAVSRESNERYRRLEEARDAARRAFTEGGE